MTGSYPYPAARVFAAEFSSAEEIQDGFKTPFGVFSPKIFIVGTLTEKMYSGNTVFALRVSDPTGVFKISLNRYDKDTADEVNNTDTPSFISVFGSVCFKKYGGRTYPDIIAEVVLPASKAVRDVWICDCAESSLNRLEGVADSADKSELVAKISSALSAAVSKPAAKTPDDSVILEIIESLCEKKGAPILKVISKLGELGMSESAAKEVLSRLFDEGEIYSPTKETIKPA